MIEGLNKLIEEAVKEGIFPGANYSLIVKGKKYFGSFGAKALLPVREENDLDTLYDMASVSKVLSTTTCAMLLLERGLLRLDDLVCSYLPEFKQPEITIWDLMTHSSGLPAIVPGFLNKDKKAILETIFNIELKYPKNTQILYSCVGYIVLGFVIEKITSQKLNDFAKENIFKPLEMTDTQYNPTDIKRCATTEQRGEKFDRGYVHDEVCNILDGKAGNSGVFSTVKDVANFMEMILNNGKFKNKTFFSKHVINLLFTSQIEEPNHLSKRTSKRGLGWILQGRYSPSGDLASSNTIMHTGFTGTHLFIDKDNEVAFCLLSNRVHPSRDNNKIIAWRAKVGNYIISQLA